MRRRAGALIVVNRELLLLSENNQALLWTPGGKLEDGETYEQALARELSEELGATIAHAELFMELPDPEADEHVSYFMTVLDGAIPEAPEGMRLHMYTRGDHEEQRVRVSQRLEHIVIPQLLSKDIL